MRSIPTSHSGLGFVQADALRCTANRAFRRNARVHRSQEWLVKMLIGKD